mmetsp:Transcript_78264/g.114613  ORF Transcript_78264/g.114613 Transcript_78264/m.114613 type:complete len:82 (+) Transcript_78264:1109-1354(+)
MHHQHNSQQMCRLEKSDWAGEEVGKSERKVDQGVARAAVGWLPVVRAAVGWLLVARGAVGWLPAVQSLSGVPTGVYRGLMR